MRRGSFWRIIAPGLLIGGFVLLHSTTRVQAGPVTSMRDYLVRQTENLSSGEQHQIFFSPATSLAGSGNTVELSFPISDSGLWCRIAGTDLSVVGITDPEGATENATVLPGTLAGECQPGNGSTTADQLIISGVGPLTSSEKYGLVVSDVGGGTAQLGTPFAKNNILVNIKTTDGAIDVDDGFFWMSILPNDRVTISATVISAPTGPSDPVVQFQGLASSEANLTIIRDGGLVQSLTANLDASFSHTLVSQTASQHIYEITASDTAGLNHPSLTFALNLAPGSTTVISGIFFGSTLSVQPVQINLGETVTLQGRTAPNSTINLTIDSSPSTQTTTTDSLGQWSLIVTADGVSVGTHSASVTVTAPDLTVSEPSRTVTFSVSRINPPVNQPPPVTTFRTSDLNQDGRVDLIDFSILLFFWLQVDPDNNRVDINRDGRVSMVDFSVMLFQWTD